MKARYLFAFAILAAPLAHAATATWDGGGADANWGTAANWNPDGAPTFNNQLDITMTGSVQPSNYLSVDRTIRSLSFNSGTNFTVLIAAGAGDGVGKKLTFTANSGNASVNVTGAGNHLVGNAIGTMTLGSNLTIAHNGTGTLTFSRIIDDAGVDKTITHSGTGTSILSNANTYGGATTINGGVLKLGNASALGATTGDTFVNSGGTLDTNNKAVPTGEAVSIIGTGQGGIGALYSSTGAAGNANAVADGLILTGNASVGCPTGVRYGVGGNGAATTGAFTLTKVGAGQFDLRGAVNIGDVIINGGIFQTQASSFNSGNSITANTGTEFRTFDIGTVFGRAITLNSATLNSTGSAVGGDTFSGNVTLSGANTISSSGDVGDKIIFTGNISESAAGASVTIGGTRRVVLGGTNSYTGATSVNASSTLQASGSFAAGISVAASGILDGEGSTAGTLTLAAGSSLYFDPSTTGANQYLRANDVVVSGAGTVLVNASSTTSGTGIVVLHDDTGGINLANFTLQNAGRASLSLGGTGGDSDLIYNYTGANLEWRGTNGPAWGIQDSFLNFQNLGTSAPDDFYVRDNVSFTDAATGVVILTDTVTDHIVAGNVTFNNTTGHDVDLQRFNTESFEAVSLVQTSSGNVAIAAPIIGTTSLTLNGTGTMLLAGTNTNTGAVTVNSGTLQLGNGSVGGTLPGAIANNGAVVVNRADTVPLLFSNPISGSGTFTYAGGGTLTLTTDQTFTGLTTVASGTLQLGNNAATGIVAGNILNNSVLNLGRTTDFTFAGNISGTGAVNKISAGNTNLTGTNTFSGGLTISSGTITGTPTSIGSSTITLTTGATTGGTLLLNSGTYSNNITYANGGTNNRIINFNGASAHVVLTGTITAAADATLAGVTRFGVLNADQTAVISGKITGTGTSGFAKRGLGTLVITGNTNDYTGPTNIVDAGTLIVDGNVPGLVLFGANIDGSVGGSSIGTLGGSGSIGGNVTLKSDSNLSPGGASASGVTSQTVATLTVGGTVDISAIGTGTGRVRMQLGALASSDRVVAGALNIGAGTLGLNEVVITEMAGLQTGTYTLISTTSGITGTLDPANVSYSPTTLPGTTATLSISGNNLVLTIATANPYNAWAASFPALANPAFGFDFDNDGISTGLEWIMGGNPTVNDAASIAPTMTGDATNGLTLNFRREEDSIGFATVTVEYGSGLGSWPGSTAIGSSSSGPDGNGVTVNVNAVPDPDNVSVNIPASNAVGGKLFGRVKATMP